MIATATPTRTLPDLSVAELSAWLRQHEFNAVHAPRVIHGLLTAQEPKCRLDFLWPEALEKRLRADFPSAAAVLATRQVSADGTSKLLLLLRRHDGCTVESVLMPVYREDRAAGFVSG